jgi:cytochrome c556
MRMRARLFIVALGSVASLSMAAPVAPDVSTLILDRRTHMEEFNAAMQALGQQIMSGKPDRAIVIEQARHIHELAQAMPGWFPAGTGSDSKGDSAALPAIWEKPEEFAAKIATLSAATADLAELSKTGDLRQLMSKAITVDRACVACHQSFQKR